MAVIIPNIFSFFHSYIFFICIYLFSVFDPSAFNLSPDIPPVLFPWLLSNQFYLPKRITLLLSTILDNCIVAPLIEEYFKYLLFKFFVISNAKNSSNEKHNDLRDLPTQKYERHESLRGKYLAKNVKKEIKPLFYSFL
jgi:hypothetical protein